MGKKLRKINRELDKCHKSSSILLEIAAEVRALDGIYECSELQCLLTQLDSPAQSTASPTKEQLASFPLSTCKPS